MPKEELKSLARKLVSTLWFPMFFVVGFMVFYLIPFHAPAPHNVPVAVVGDRAAASIQISFDDSVPDGYDISSVPDEGAARQAVRDRDVVAAYDPSDGEMFYASANGRMAVQMLRQSFAPVAAQSGQQLTLTDLASTAPGDVMGTGLFYCLMAMNIPPYILVMMLLRAELTTRQKLGAMVGFGAVSSLVCYFTALSLDVIYNDPLLLLIGFLLTQGIVWTVYGLVPIVKQFIPGVAIGIFVLLSMPSSGGAVPLHFVHPLFQFLHYVMPLGSAVDAMRGILYFDGTGALRSTLVLCAWFVFGAALVTFNHFRAKRLAAAHAPERDTAGQRNEGAEREVQAEYEHEDDSGVTVDPALEAPEPVHRRTLAGAVTDGSGAALPGASVTVTDGRGVQIARMLTSPEGEYRVHDLPDEPVTVVASAVGVEPAVDRLRARAGRVERCDFLLDDETESRSVRPAGVAGA
ncbi:Carboxypeptidase regulatory-like domain-containing protein [Actinopolyspora xinjiangensis]|uniref:Carboxypeptidase regulatory-like domain-containing protein n=1 Tax=Actinopolyspora xinjiangensis TaxID=405564 RepID=A0A1H0NRY8_9ACTN|nr:carboxypeptidase regulatory-like domain-containing protein [Actinopolyspora xinjiangensis]SDO95225.1 Carboxypeptidase regulatory-like domain-containing protein [Actinopolyspora xinjiangensis]